MLYLINKIVATDYKQYYSLNWTNKNWVILNQINSLKVNHLGGRGISFYFYFNFIFSLLVFVNWKAENKALKKKS